MIKKHISYFLLREKNGGKTIKEASFYSKISGDLCFCPQNGGVRQPQSTLTGKEVRFAIDLRSFDEKYSYETRVLKFMGVLVTLLLTGTFFTHLILRQPSVK